MVLMSMVDEARFTARIQKHRRVVIPPSVMELLELKEHDIVEVVVKKLKGE